MTHLFYYRLERHTSKKKKYNVNSLQFTQHLIYKDYLYKNNVFWNMQRNPNLESERRRRELSKQNEMIVIDENPNYT